MILASNQFYSPCFFWLYNKKDIFAEILTNDFLEADQFSDQEIASCEFGSYRFDSPLLFFDYGYYVIFVTLLDFLICTNYHILT